MAARHQRQPTQVQNSALSRVPRYPHRLLRDDEVNVVKLSVNINKVAVLRNSRGGLDPDPVYAAQTAIQAGCDGITVHPRPDQRHITVADIPRIAAALGEVEFNIEGNPFAPPRGTYPGLLELARQARPAQVTLVPDGDGQITSDHGFDLARDSDALRPLVAELKQLRCRVSLFIDAGTVDLDRVAEIGADCVEIYTGPFAMAHATGAWQEQLDACVRTAESARSAGLGVNAGHDLSQLNLPELVRGIPWLAEVSIGHALFAEALYDGLAPTVQRYVQILQRAAA